ncbi:LysR family transcriptional regulator [Variovorax sp.]|uniref:LysR family transcriptional regulator n=1 Tax=Variovorax sp. TaxID=1871043 RepID=UPI002D276850|nr:LysR family transcriptional regulator [Variovorax sp.]HYP82156.1 LysR family transcriptional regulator [Variovorax sp.]
MDPILAMRTFVRVVESGNFTRAAESLRLPKGTVTKQIQSLEERVQSKLLNRTTRRVSVTPDGAAYYERVARLLGEFDELESSMTNAQASPKGVLRIDVGSSTAQLLIIPRLKEFCDQYPEIQVDLGVTDRPVDLLSENVDCVIRVGQLRDQSLVARRIGMLPFVTVAAPDYIRRYGVPGHPSDLEKRHHAVAFFSQRSRGQHSMQFKKDGEEVEVTVPYRVAVNEANAHFRSVLEGFGISQCVTFQAAPHLDKGELVEVLPEWTRDPLPIYVVYPPNRHLSPKVRAFVDWAAELFSQHPHLQAR